MKSSRALIISLVIFVLVTLLGVLAYGFLQYQPAEPTAQAPETFVVSKGAGAQQIANKLKNENLIKNPYLFRLYLKISGMENKLQAGSHEISASMTLPEIAEKLTTGSEDVWITLLEGWRAEEIADYLESQELSQFDKAEFLTLAATSEGRLYPDTYLVPREMTTRELHSLLVSTFETKIEGELASQINSSARDFEDILTMASLIEREARDFEQMRHVAGILWNRIEIGMPLQVDATLQYAKGSNSATGNWWSTPLAADKTVVSPYNTYTNPGLPPGPIANPGLNALKAALDPMDVNDLFYLHAPDGKMYFARTIDEHNANVNTHLR